MDKKPIVLAVDDEADLLELSTTALKAKGFEVLEARNGQEALEWLARKGDEIKLVLLDIIMPITDGFEVLEVMQKKFKEIPVIVASNLDSDTDRQSAFALGAKFYYEKVKYTPNQIAEKIQELISCKKQ